MTRICIGCLVQDGSFKVNGGFIHESKRHIQIFDQFTEEEHQEYSTFLFEVRKEMKFYSGLFINLETKEQKWEIIEKLKDKFLL